MINSGSAPPGRGGYANCSGIEAYADVGVGVIDGVGVNGGGG